MEKITHAPLKLTLNLQCAPELKIALMSPQTTKNLQYTPLSSQKTKMPFKFFNKTEIPLEIRGKKKAGLVAHGSANPRPTTAAVGLSPLFFSY
jgi:hypothetical protein